jgi:hypothetical protein
MVRLSPPAPWRPPVVKTVAERGPEGVAELEAALATGLFLALLFPPVASLVLTGLVTFAAIVLRHALRNAFNPILSVVGLVFAVLIGGDAIVETVFAWPGIGHLMVEATTQRDYPVMMGTTMVIGASVILINILVDVTYGLLDPRVRYD